MYDIDKIKKDLKNNLSQFRYEHSILVADEAKKLALHYNYDSEKAYVAGLVHDIAKEFDDSENDKWIKKYNLSGDIFTPQYKNVVHANVGAVVVKELYGFDDEICNSVCYHAIGNVPMGWLDKIVFVADKIARRISTPFIDELKILAYQDIDKAIALYLNNQIGKLESRGLKMHPTSLELLKCLENKNI